MDTRRNCLTNFFKTPRVGIADKPEELSAVDEGLVADVANPEVSPVGNSQSQPKADELRREATRRFWEEENGQILEIAPLKAQRRVLQDKFTSKNRVLLQSFETTMKTDSCEESDNPGNHSEHHERDDGLDHEGPDALEHAVDPPVTGDVLEGLLDAPQKPFVQVFEMPFASSLCCRSFALSRKTNTHAFLNDKKNIKHNLS